MQAAPATTESATIRTEEQFKCVMLLGLSSSQPFQAYSFVCTCISQKTDHVQRMRTPKVGLAVHASYWLNISLFYFFIFILFFIFIYLFILFYFSWFFFFSFSLMIDWFHTFKPQLYGCWREQKHLSRVVHFGFWHLLLWSICRLFIGFVSSTHPFHSHFY